MFRNDEKSTGLGNFRHAFNAGGLVGRSEIAKNIELLLFAGVRGCVVCFRRGQVSEDVVGGGIGGDVSVLVAGFVVSLGDHFVKNLNENEIKT